MQLGDITPHKQRAPIDSFLDTFLGTWLAHPRQFATIIRVLPTRLFVAMLLLFLLPLLLSPIPVHAGNPISLAWDVQPAAIQLQGHHATAQVVVLEFHNEPCGDDERGDVTHQVHYTSLDEGVVTVSPTGLVTAVGNGTSRLRIEGNGQSHDIPVEVTGMGPRPEIDFHRHISPLLSKVGCNQGACHASQHGKGDFKLSVLGFDPDEDFDAIARDRLQRRVNRLEPERSLLLQKPTMQVAHGGGRRLDRDSTAYALLHDWIAAGAPAPQTDSPPVTTLAVFPDQRLGRQGMTQQLRVAATYADGTVRDVTRWAKYDSMDEGLLEVTPEGVVTAIGRGQAPVMVRFEGQAEIALFSIPFRDEVDLADWAPQNYVDEWAERKFRELGVPPSPLCDDATFLRRVYLDCIGTLPTLEETRRFLDSTDPDKRNQLVDRLLGLTGDSEQDLFHNEYAAFWTLKWSDLIRANSRALGNQGMWALHNWLRDSFRRNVPFDEMARELVTAKGSVYSNGPANYFLINRDSSTLAEATSQLFLGVRLECAKCHHHPFESYRQDDYYHFAAFFARVGFKNSEGFGLFGRERVVVVNAAGEVKHPKTGQSLAPRAFGGEALDHFLDRRIPLADWLTSPDNEYFAQAVVNRYVAHFLGRGLVDPVDDLRATNPATNPDLIRALADRFVASEFDLKLLIRDLVTSRVYQLDSRPLPENEKDDRFYSHFRVKRLAAEPLLDAIDTVTAAPTKFPNLPAGTRAIELPDAEYANYFLNTFGKPRRATICDCERSPDPNLAQALHTLNGDTLMEKIGAQEGRIARLLAEELPLESIVEELYLVTLCRPPLAAELEACREMIVESPNVSEAYEDLLWALMNSKEFLFVH